MKTQRKNPQKDPKETSREEAMQSPFSAQASNYLKYRPSYPDEMYEFIFRHLERRQKAWDCGTGSGQVASFLATRFEEVYATDISEEQLRNAPARANIRYIHAAAEHSSLPADSFDLITVGQAIHWFDFDRFYREVERTARDNALLAVFGYGKVSVNPPDNPANPVIERLYLDAFQDHYNRQRSYVENHYRTLPFPFDEISAPSFQTTASWSLKDLAGYFSTWSSVQKILSESGENPAIENPVAKAMDELRRLLPPEERFQVKFPVFLRLGRIRKS